MPCARYGGSLESLNFVYETRDCPKTDQGSRNDIYIGLQCIKIVSVTPAQSSRLPLFWSHAYLGQSQALLSVSLQNANSKFVLGK